MAPCVRKREELPSYQIKAIFQLPAIVYMCLICFFVNVVSSICLAEFPDNNSLTI